jgi:predicted metal-binding membrane protein
MTDDRISAPLPARNELSGVLLSVLGLAAASWTISIASMSGMNMGVATDLGSLGHFLPLWVTMMAAMMLPSVAAPLLRQSSIDSGARTVPAFLLGYLAVWAAIGLLAYAAYRPHGSTVAGAVVIAAGMYELTPVKRRCREQCLTGSRSGLTFGIACFGSSVGLMSVLLAISPMSLVWMAVIAAVIVAQKVFSAAWLVDIPLALAIVGLGGWILADPSTVPALMPPM